MRLLLAIFVAAIACGVGSPVHAQASPAPAPDRARLSSQRLQIDNARLDAYALIGAEDPTSAPLTSAQVFTLVLGAAELDVDADAGTELSRLFARADSVIAR